MQSNRERESWHNLMLTSARRSISLYLETTPPIMSPACYAAHLKATYPPKVLDILRDTIDALGVESACILTHSERTNQ